MSKGHLSITQRVVNSIWKVVKLSENRPTPVEKPKLNGRRGYGDDGIASPDRTPDEK
jgi:hypothetical protein